MRSFSQKVVEDVIDSLDYQLYDCADDLWDGSISMDMLECINRTVINTLDNWDPKLTYEERCAILDWVQDEYGLIL